MPKSDLNVDLGLTASASASLSLETNAAWYRLFLHASARFAQTERDDLLIWSVSA